MIAHELNFVLLRPDASGHSPILIGIHFVLRRQRLHWHTFGRIPLQKLQVSPSPEGDLLILQHPYTGVVHEHLPRRNIDTPA